MALFCNLLPPPHLSEFRLAMAGRLRQSAGFLDLAEKCLISDLETASGHLFFSGWALATQRR